jgi:signal transduction histidine kinase
MLVEITDSGKGIKEVGRVFEPFYTTKAVGKGTGLGLAICYGIVAAHGGEIFARNIASRGASFTISIPVSPQASGAKNAQPQSNAFSAASR